MNKIIERQQKERDLLIEQLKKTPIIQIACERIGIGRATYYRWRQQDVNFAKSADDALDEGIRLMNDMAESKLLSAVKEGNLTGIIFWLKNRHNAYKTRIEVSSAPKEEIILNSDQEKIMKLAVGIAQEEPKKEEKNE